MTLLPSSQQRTQQKAKLPLKKCPQGHFMTRDVFRYNGDEQHDYEWYCKECKGFFIETGKTVKLKEYRSWESDALNILLFMERFGFKSISATRNLKKGNRVSQS